MTKYNKLNLLKEYALITIGVILVSIGIQYFFAPNEIAGGGLSGISIIITSYTDKLSLGTIMFIGNLILFTISFILIGGDFGFKTIYASVMLSVAMDVMEKVFHSYALTTNMVLAVVGGAAICAVGLAIAFSINASTGGTDILAKILTKYTSFNIGRALLVVDLFVVVWGVLTFGLQKGIYSLMAVIVNGLLIDFFIAKIEKNRKNKEELVEVQEIL